MTARIHRVPWTTMALVALALAAWLVPGANETLQFDRAALAAGELWRLITGHVTHWTSSHLAWDLAAFVVLGVLVERTSRRLLGLTLATSALAISAAVWLFEPHLATYRGLSGVDSALFATWAATAIRHAAGKRQWSTAGWIAAAALGFAAKTAVESLAQSTVFVAADPTFVPVPLAHVAGAGAGLLVAVALAYSSSANAAQVAAAWPCGSPTMRRRSM
jgi:rhomboid family GlyGly-CTERM serine protease